MRYVATVGLVFVILVSPAAPQPPTLAGQPLVIEGRVLGIDFGTETLMLAPATGARPSPSSCTASDRTTTTGSVGTSTCSWWATLSGQAAGPRHSSSTW
jgi:hypothetical protein